MTDLLTANDFPYFTRYRLGLPFDMEPEDIIDRYLEQAQDEITDAIGQSEVEKLLDDAPENANRRRRFRSAYRELTESLLWAAAASGSAQNVGTQRQGARQTTVDASVVSEAHGASANAFERYVRIMQALGYLVRSQPEFSVPMERV